jgi:hypothetical protein
MSEGSSLLWGLVATSHYCQNVIANVGASSNGTMMSDNSSLLWGLVAAALVSRASHVVATGETCPLLLGWHSSDRTTTMTHLPIATVGYRPLVHIDVLY